MNQTTVVVQGVVTADGTLELTEKLHVPAGRVQVLIQPLPDVSSDTLSQRMEAVWAGQKGAGMYHAPGSRLMPICATCEKTAWPKLRPPNNYTRKASVLKRTTERMRSKPRNGFPG